MKIRNRIPVFMLSSSALVAIALSGCLSDNDDAATAAQTLAGTAAIGAPIVGGTVNVKCAGGSEPGPVTTKNDGTWQVTLSGQTLPCAVRVQNGTIEGEANSNIYHAAAWQAGTVNITPLSDLTVAHLAGAAPSAWYGSLGSSSFQQITATAMNAAMNRVLTALNMGDALTGFNPLTASFKAEAGDKVDDVLKALQGAINGLSLDHAALLDAVKGSSISAPAGFGHTFARALTAGDPTPTTLTLEKIGGFVPGVAAAHEITAYDPASKRVFVVNGAQGTVDVLSLVDPANPSLIESIDVSAWGGGVNGVAVRNGVVALAVEGHVKQNQGRVLFYKAADLSLISSAAVGALPDMLTFTSDGKYLLVANEGEPSSDYLNDPEGSISIVDVRDILNPSVRTADFQAFNSKKAELLAAGVRIFGPNASVAQDLEPEYITVSKDGRTAWVTLQENNAIAIVDIATAKVTDIKPLGYKDHSLAGMGMDVSNEDGGTNTNSGSATIKIAPVPVKGMYMPDAITSYTVNGETYLITANEGDAREYLGTPGFVEETRVRDYCGVSGFDPVVFGDAAATLGYDSNLGRLIITKHPGGTRTGKNEAGQCNELVSFGARSFSIWNGNVERVFDSGDDFEQRTKDLLNVNFNASNSNNTLESRSPSKGPEPEAVVVAKFGTKHFAFIGLERVGGIMVYDVTNPTAPSFVTYINSRNGETGDRGPEGITFVSAAASPNGKPLLIVGNETSGTTAIIQINLQE